MLMAEPAGYRILDILVGRVGFDLDILVIAQRF
jgi:hypothetical protein